MSLGHDVIETMQGREAEGRPDDTILMDWVQSEEVYVSPHSNPSSEGAAWHVHHLGRNRLYNGATMREAISNAILNINASIPAYELLRLTGEEFTCAIPESLAREKGML